MSENQTITENGKVICQECGEKKNDLNLHIYYKHEFDTEEYQRRYPDAPMKAEDWIEKHVEKGERLREEGKVPETKTGSDNPYWKGGKIEVECTYENCGRKVEKHPSDIERSKNIFCSKKCMGKWRREHWVGTDNVGNFEGHSHSEEHKQYMSETLSGGKLVQKMEENPNWKGGTSFKPYPPEFNEELKEKIRERDNRTCQLCGLETEEIDRKLCVHHIDYVKPNVNPMNLLTLCHRCNSKVNGRRNFWMCYFRWNQGFFL